MKAMNPYLNFNGNTEEAFNFYKSVFGGEFSTLQRFKDTPEANKVTENEKDKIMHVSLPIGQGSFLMASDALESMKQKVNPGNNFYLTLNTESEEETNRIFNGLSAGGNVEMPLNKTFWGAYFGMFTDKFGIRWMVNYEFNEEK
jgi:PhnB protein